MVAAEKWIVNMIRNARLDAKIDSAKNHVIMGTQYPSMYVAAYVCVCARACVCFLFVCNLCVRCVM